MARGRKRKAGNRTRSGRLSRAGVPAVRIDRGNPRAELRTELYGTNGSDAIGRAYERGLLGTGSEAKAMLDTARAIHRAYWAWYATGPIRCALADRNGAAVEHDEDREKKQERWLNDMIRTVERGGRAVRVVFDHLVVDINPDYGPIWLDRIIERQAKDSDWVNLTAALDALAECAGVRRLTAMVG
jgi:hypothetical protein